MSLKMLRKEIDNPQTRPYKFRLLEKKLKKQQLIFVF